MLRKLTDVLIMKLSQLMVDKRVRQSKLITPPENVVEYLNIPYTNRKGKELMMDVFQPTDTKDPDLPLIIFVHGGGLVIGDKSGSRVFCHELARRGFLVFTLNYQLIPAVSVYEQFDDISAGMDAVGRKIIDFDVNPFRIYLVAESAGAYLAIYTAALAKSKKMQEAIGHKPTVMSFKAMALIGGMFYTKNNDPVGRILSKHMYRDAKLNKAMEPYLDPENKEVAGNLPPCMLITSEHDFLRKYTEKLIGFLWKYGVDYHYVYMGDDIRFKHCFPVFHPLDPESQKVIDVIKQWFDKY